MFTRVLVTVTLVVCAIDASSAFAISPESVALQTAAIGSKISDIRNTAAEVTQAVGETIQTNVNAAVDTVNQASAAATSTLNNALVTGQNAVQGVVTQTQNVVNGAVSATQEVVGSTVQTASNALQTAANVVLTPFRLVGNHVSDKFVLISNQLYQMVHPNLDQEVVYVPVSPDTYAYPGVVVPSNHRVTYTEVLPSYTYKSGGVDEYLTAGSEQVESIVVPDATKEDKPLLPTVENGASLPHFEYPDVRLPTQPIYEVNPKTGLIQFNHPAYTSLSQKASSSILPYDEREIDVTTDLVRNKRIVNEDIRQFFR